MKQGLITVIFSGTDNALAVTYFASNSAPILGFDLERSRGNKYDDDAHIYVSEEVFRKPLLPSSSHGDVKLCVPHGKHDHDYVF